MIQVQRERLMGLFCQHCAGKGLRPSFWWLTPWKVDTQSSLSLYSPLKFFLCPTAGDIFCESPFIVSQIYEKLLVKLNFIQTAQNYI